MIVVINILGLMLIGFIVWWFWLEKPRKRFETNDDTVEIMVDKGVYEPSQIKIPPHQSITLRFFRKDATPCSAVVHFPDLNIIEELPLNHFHAISIPPLAKGKYPFTCEMAMYRGVLIVESNSD